MKKTFLTLLASLLLITSFGQKVVTREAFLQFHGDTPLENITGTTDQASSVIDLETGAFVYQALMKSFVFEKALMQEHFNENYIESDQYPKCLFQGKFDNWEKVEIDKDGSYDLIVNGVMNLHGVDQPMNAKVKLTFKGEKITLESQFYMTPEDYKIEIPSTVRDKIAEKFEVKAKANYMIK